MQAKSPLENMKVASPCAVSWDSMRGEARARFCESCRLNVYNLSEMTREEAEALVRSREGRLCVRFYRRADGTVLTRDCPVGLRAVRLRAAKLAGAVAGLALLLMAGALRKLGWRPIVLGPEAGPIMGEIMPPLER